MRSLILVLILAVPLAAQEPPTPAAQATGRKPEVVVVHSGMFARPAPAKIVRVVPPPVSAPQGAYEGTRPYRDWRWYGAGGLARSRAAYAVWRTRFAPVHPFRHVNHFYRGYGYRHFGGHGRVHTPRWRW